MGTNWKSRWLIQMIVNAVIWLLLLYLLIIKYHTVSSKVLMMVGSVLWICQWCLVVMAGVHLRTVRRYGNISERLFSRANSQQKNIVWERIKTRLCVFVLSWCIFHGSFTCWTHCEFWLWTTLARKWISWEGSTPLGGNLWVIIL